LIRTVRNILPKVTSSPAQSAPQVVMVTGP
jgi:hypothetical protein